MYVSLGMFMVKWTHAAMCDDSKCKYKRKKRVVVAEHSMKLPFPHSKFKVYCSLNAIKTLFKLFFLHFFY